MKTALSILMLPALLLAACSPAAAPSTPVPAASRFPAASPTASPVPGEIVQFTTEDNLILSGTLYGSGKIAVILAHQGTPGTSQSSWRAFAQLLAEHGYTALTFDFRGVGASKGIMHYGNLGMDVKAARQFLQQRGFSSIACAGASMGGTACMIDAMEEKYLGLIILASTMEAGNGIDSLKISDDDLAALTAPKLFITAENDYSIVVNDTRHMAEVSPDPKSLLILPGSVHGTYLFRTEAGEALTTAMLNFLDDLQRQAFTPVLSAQIDGTTGPVYSVAWSPDGRLLASSPHTLRVRCGVETTDGSLSPNPQRLGAGGGPHAGTIVPIRGL